MFTESRLGSINKNFYEGFEVNIYEYFLRSVFFVYLLLGGRIEVFY